MEVVSTAKQYAKAIFIAIVTPLGGIITALQSNPEWTAVGDLSQEVWLVIALATVVAVGGVFGLTNTPK